MCFTLKTFGEFYTKNLPTKSSFPSAVFLHQISLVIEVRPHEVLIPWKQTEPNPTETEATAGGNSGYIRWLGWWSKNGLDLGDCWKLGWIFFHVLGDVFFVCIFVVVCCFHHFRPWAVGDKVSSACVFFPRRRLMQIQGSGFQDVKFFLTLQQQNRWRENRNLSLVSLEECSKIKWF